jgi:hypothetical protein
VAATKHKRKPMPALRPELEIPTRALLEQGKQPDEVAAHLLRSGYAARDAERLAAHLDERYRAQLRGERQGASIDALIDAHASRKSSLPSVLAVMALFEAGLWYMIARQPGDLGKPCSAPSDCESGLCMSDVTKDRTVTSGYCSKICEGISTCDSGLQCEEVVEGNGQPGQAWDGMMGKKHRACVKP